MNQYYFYDNAKDQKGIVKAKNRKEFLLKFIEIASNYDSNFINDMFDRLRDAEIEIVPLNGLKVYE